MDTTSNMKFSSILLRQFNNSWQLLKQCIQNIDDNNWSQISYQPNDHFWVFSLTVYHILETTDFYFRSSPEGMEWGKRGKINWKSTQPLDKKFQYLTKELIQEYLMEIKEKITHILNETHHHQLYASDGFYSHLPTILDKYLYLLRHNLMHIGELNKVLRDWNLPRINWE